MSDLTERLAAAGVPSQASVLETVRVFYAANGATTIPEVRDEMMRAQIAADAGLLLLRPSSRSRSWWRGWPPR